MGFCSQSERVHRKQNVTDQLKATYRRTINSDVIIIQKHASGSKGNIYTETLTVLLDRLFNKTNDFTPVCARANLDGGKTIFKDYFRMGCCVI